ncbi:DEAD/DEAH box helicase family protein [Candidatus Pacearchaeota archaeon]|nr:DEAD/DEAH box helicase family protein [Candidatus Pacearchaeota archaeon]
MLKFNRRAGIAIPREYENEVFYTRIRDHLFRRVQNFNTPDFTIMKFYLETKKFLTVPRFFPVESYVNCKIIDNSHDGEEIDFTHNISPRDKTQQETMDFMLQNSQGIIQLSPGMGKTIISIHTIAQRKRKTFILVHRKSLDAQWEERFLQFTSLKKSDIAQMTSANFEECLKRPIIICTTQTFISLLKRKRMEWLIALNEANIGIFIGDEVHTSVGAPTFSECSIHLPAKNIYGLSATPYRWDGNTDIIEYHLGELFVRKDDSSTMKPDVTILMFDYGVDIPRRYKYLYWENRFQRSRYLNLIKKSTIFNKVCQALLEKFSVEERNVFYISERINLLEEMEKYITEVVTDDVEKFISGSTLEALQSRFTLSTPGKVRDGIDAPWKDCCILTSPIKNIDQMTGRITRQKKGKKTPIVIDMVDIGCAQIANTMYGRLEHYTNKKWNVKFIIINQNYQKREITKLEAVEILKSRR